MVINNEILDGLTKQAKASPRLRMNLDLRNSPEDQSQRMLNAIEPGTVMHVLVGQWHSLRSIHSGTVLPECKDGAYSIENQ